MDLLAAIQQWAATVPDRVAHQSGDQSLTYQELNRNADILACYMADTLPDDASPVAVIGHKEPEMLVAFLGAVKAGHPYIPVDTSAPAQRVRSILEIAKTQLVLTPERIRELLLNLPRPLSPLPARKIAPETPWYIIFTSGSTGEPKGVVITAGCLESFVDWMLAEQHLEEGGEVFLNQAPFSFDLSVMDLYQSLATGGKLFSISKDEIANPSELYRSLANSEVTVWVSTPSFAQMCLAEPGFTAGMLPRLRKFLFCGETLAPEVAAGLLERFPGAEVWNTYGPTEATCATTSVRLSRALLERYAPLPVGYAKPDTRVMVIGDDGQGTLTEGERGEIVIAGPNVSPGYLGRPDLTERAFFLSDGQRAYRTGDWGHFQEGLLFFDGRMDNQIKLHGYRIELGDVEANLLSNPAIQDVVVLPVMKAGRPDSLAAFVILKEEPAGGSDYEVTRALKRDLGQHLPAYMIPRKFYFLNQFPMTPNGKTDRRKLAEGLA
jgi:D-alanine--poly(phosphoribitol) ligase subunit 1